jgi:hypothetical protein
MTKADKPCPYKHEKAKTERRIALHSKPKPKKKPKTVLLYVVQGNYGYGWDDECASEDWKEARNDLQAYQDNAPGGHRIIKRRVPNV